MFLHINVVCMQYYIYTFPKRNMPSFMEYLWLNQELLVHYNKIFKYYIYGYIYKVLKHLHLITAAPFGVQMYLHFNLQSLKFVKTLTGEIMKNIFQGFIFPLLRKCYETWCEMWNVPSSCINKWNHLSFWSPCM